MHGRNAHQCELRVARREEQNVVRPHVAVHPRMPVQIRQRVGHLPHDGRRYALGEALRTRT